MSDERPLLPLPKLLVHMLKMGTWQRIKQPQVQGTPVVLVTRDEQLIPSPYEAKVLQQAGIDEGTVDFKRCIFIAFGARDGDDTWVALDYRQSGEPAVICTDWSCESVRFKKIADSFPDFVAMLTEP